MNFDFTFLFDAFKDTAGFMSFLIIGSLLFFFIIQIVAWITPPSPKFLHVFGVGIFWVAFWIFVVYNYVPLAPALINNSVNGIYGIPGYIWVGSMVFLIFIFLVNTTMSWMENKPLEVIQ